MTRTSAIGAATRRGAIAAVIAAMVLLGGAACTPEQPASEKPVPTSAQPSESATPTEEPLPPLSATAMDGYWRAIPAGEAGFAVRGDLLVYSNGMRARILPGEGDFVSVINEDAKSCDEGETGSCAPLGQLVPAGTAVEIPDYAEGITDDPKVDRIWNGQGGVLYVREPLPTAKDFPEALQGEWCSEDGTVCFSVDELLAENPVAFAQDPVDSELIPGAQDIQLCLAADLEPGQCSTAASMALRHFDKGAKWDCAAYVAKAGLGDITECDSKTVVAHDMSKERLLLLPNHQHDKLYNDSVPLYRK